MALPRSAARKLSPAIVTSSGVRQQLGIDINILEAASKDQLAASLDRIIARRSDALLTTAGFLSLGWPQVMQFAIDRKLPTIMDYVQRPSDERVRPLLAYAPSIASLTKTAFAAVDRILKGESPLICRFSSRRSLSWRSI